MTSAKTMAVCAMTAALSVVLMIIGGVLGLGMYASPMIAGLCLLPVGRICGRKYQWMVWAAVSVLSLLVVPEAEQNLMYIALFGLYPLLYPGFQRLKGRIRLLCKLAYFNVTVLAVEALVMMVLAPEAMSVLLAVVLLVMGNIVFVCYDFLLPRAEGIFRRFFSGRKGRIF